MLKLDTEKLSAWRNSFKFYLLTENDNNWSKLYQNIKVNQFYLYITKLSDKFNFNFYYCYFYNNSKRIHEIKLKI